MVGKKLVVFRFADSPRWERARAVKFTAIVETVIKLHAIHCLFLPPPGARKMFKKRILPMMTSFFKTEIAGEQHGYLGRTASDLRTYLEEIGFRAGSLPTQLGGTWSSKDVPAWNAFEVAFDETVATGRRNATRKLSPDEVHKNVCWKSESPKAKDGYRILAETPTA